MSVNSAAFLLFLAVSVTIYYITPKKLRYVVLLGASAFFYLSFSIRAAIYLLFTVLTTYAAAHLIGALWKRERCELNMAGADRQTVKKHGQCRRRIALTVILILNFATLAVFKYLNSWLGLADSLLGIFGVVHSFRPLELLIPLGISFYIFQTSGYLIDVYRGRVEPEKNLLKYALFASYFPQMIQGPINRFGMLMPQLSGGSDFSADNIKYGIQLMLWGMLKKVFIADPLSGAVAEVYGNYTMYSGAVLFLGAALYCLQLYCDFSGGTDLVRGASQLFGVEMAENFRRPYFARSVDEFWRRWHISLGEWMKDYLFYPLALSGTFSRLGKKVKKSFGAGLGKRIAPCIATVIVFLAVGVWQGPGLSNIAYGLWNGGLMSLAMLCEEVILKTKKKIGLAREREIRWFKGFQILRTCLLVIIGRYFSRATSLRQALAMLKRTVSGFGFVSLDTFTCFGLDGKTWLCLAFAVAVLFTVSILQERGVCIRKALETKHWTLQFLLLFAAVILLVTFVYLNRDYTAIEYVYENI